MVDVTSSHSLFSFGYFTDSGILARLQLAEFPSMSYSEMKHALTAKLFSFKVQQSMHGDEPEFEKFDEASLCEKSETAETLVSLFGDDMTAFQPVLGQLPDDAARCMSRRSHHSLL
jgi:hypothetical protein